MRWYHPDYYGANVLDPDGNNIEAVCHKSGQARARYGRIVAAVIRIRDAELAEAPELEALQRRSSDIWEAYREQLAANPDAIELPQRFIDNGWVRVALGDDQTPVGFSVVIPGGSGAHELDGLFVEPGQMLRGVGRALVEDAAARASDAGAERLEVTAGPAQRVLRKRRLSRDRRRANPVRPGGADEPRPSALTARPRLCDKSSLNLR